MIQNRKNKPDIPDFWLPNKILRLRLRICVSAFLHLINLLSLHKSLVYPPFVYILYDECSEDVTGEYSSVKCQWRN